jgi:ribosomal protein L37AE/L43A
MATKLRNIEPIKKMLDGTHRTQNKTTVGFSDADKVAKQNQKRAIGECWVENGEEWEQREGFKIKKGKMDEIRQLIANKMPTTCPKCNNPMTKRLDEKFWKLEKHCFDCQVDFEHNLRIEGKYEEYEKQRMLANAENWLNDAEAEARELAAAFRNPLTYANADGTIENWSGGMTGDEMAEKIENEFELFKENFISKLKHDLYESKNIEGAKESN